MCGNGYTIVCHNDKNTESKKDLLMTEIKPLKNNNLTEYNKDEIARNNI